MKYSDDITIPLGLNVKKVVLRMSPKSNGILVGTTHHDRVGCRREDGRSFNFRFKESRVNEVTKNTITDTKGSDVNLCTTPGPSDDMVKREREIFLIPLIIKMKRKVLLRSEEDIDKKYRER
uniref:Uncharacterized protein n=1 Tax=Strongyloides venezuelensis TaxID=75913 RepID=A0A0K0FSI5_STRVS